MFRHMTHSDPQAGWALQCLTALNLSEKKGSRGSFPPANYLQSKGTHYWDPSEVSVVTIVFSSGFCHIFSSNPKEYRINTNNRINTSSHQMESAELMKVGWLKLASFEQHLI